MDLLDHELRTTNDAAKKTVKALERISSICRATELAEILSRQSAIAGKQVEHLERVFVLIDRKPGRRPCPGINGLIEELSRFLEGRPSAEVLDVYAGRSAQRVWQHLIASHEFLANLSGLLGIDEAAGLLSSGVAEMQQACEELQATAALLNANLVRRRASGNDSR